MAQSSSFTSVHHHFIEATNTLLIECVGFEVIVRVYMAVTVGNHQEADSICFKERR